MPTFLPVIDTPRDQSVPTQDSMPTSHCAIQLGQQAEWSQELDDSETRGAATDLVRLGAGDHH